MSPQLQIVSRKCHIQNFLDQLEELSKNYGTTVSVIVITIKKRQGIIQIHLGFKIDW